MRSLFRRTPRRHLSTRLVCLAVTFLVTGTCVAELSPLWLPSSAEDDVAEWRDGLATQDGGFLLLGSSWGSSKKTENAGDTRDKALLVRLARLTREGSLQWAKTYGDLPRSDALGLSAAGDGGSCVLSGVYKNRLGENGSLWVLKLDNSGGSVWNRHLEGIYKGSGILIRPYETFSISGAKDGGCIVVGGTASERTDLMRVRVVLISAQGRVLWDRAYGSNSISMGLSVAETETGFLVGGIASGSKDRPAEALLLTLGRDGTLSREKRYGETGARVYALHVLPLSDGGALLSGAKLALSHTLRDAWVGRVDRDGALIWNRTFGQNSGDFFLRARPTLVEQFALFGISGYARDGSPTRALIVSVDKNGKTLKEQRFAQPIRQLMGIVPSDDGGYLLFGASMKGPSLVKVDRDGSLTPNSRGKSK